MLFAAAVYLGGAALGQWSSPFASVNNALVSESVSAAGSQATASGLASAADASTVAAEAAGGAAGGGTAIGAGAADATASGLSAMNTANEAAALQAGGSSIPQGGFINNAMKVAGNVGDTAMKYGGKAAEFADKNKLLTAMGFNAVSGALGAEAQREAEKEERRRMQENLAVGNIDLGVSPGASRASNPGGFINSRIRG